MTSRTASLRVGYPTELTRTKATLKNHVDTGLTKKENVLANFIDLPRGFIHRTKDIQIPAQRKRSIFLKNVLGLIGKKLGMGQIFEASGNVVPVTYIICEPNTVWQVKDQAKDGLDAVVLGGEKLKKERKAKKFRSMHQFAGSGDFTPGGQVDVGIFEEGENITLTGTSKGHGFTGRIARHNFRVIRKTHGTKYARHGSTGANSMPGRTKPGIKMAGRMGNDKVTTRDRQVVKVDVKRNLIAIKGPVPGAKNGIVILKKQS